MIEQPRVDGWYSRGAELFTSLVLETFRLNGCLITVGDRMTKSVGLSTARWQTLGAMALAHSPLTVPQIARSMGLQRQSVQQNVNALVRDGMVATAPNPNHQRARLVMPTAKGRTAYAKAIAIQVKWAEEMSAGIAAGDLSLVLKVMTTLRARIEHQKHVVAKRLQQPRRVGTQRSPGATQKKRS